MEIIRESSYNEVIAFYRLRQIIKGLNEEKDVLFKCFPPVFNFISVKLITINLEEFRRLVFLENNWTIEERLTPRNNPTDYRLLERVAERAINMDYINNINEGHRGYRMREYYNKIQSSDLQLNCENRIIIRSLVENERIHNPHGNYYIHDGNGRCLPYMILLLEDRIEFNKVECYCFE